MKTCDLDHTQRYNGTMCTHNPRKDYFYSVYTNQRICKYCWTSEPADKAVMDKNLAHAS